MDQLNRMFDVGVDAVGIYAKAVGKSSQEVQDSLSDKTIRTDEFLNVVEKAMKEVQTVFKRLLALLKMLVHPGQVRLIT